MTVYEVGQDGDARFIVMDRVQGGTLRAWLATPRPWREIVRMFIGAGEGLGAAHEAGLVHRDFKPDNVLVEEGKPKVVDFGLAATIADPLETTPSPSPWKTRRRSTASRGRRRSWGRRRTWPPSSFAVR